MLLPLLHLAFLSFLPSAVDSNCHDHRYGAPSKSCKRIKDEKFQIRGGVKIVPMWQYLLLKEPTFLRRAKRGSESAAPRNSTILVNNHYSGGSLQRRAFAAPQFQRASPPLQIHRYTQNAAKTHDAAMPPVRHSTLIQPIDSNAPLPVQRHVVQRQVQPSILQSTIFSANVAHQQALVHRKYKRQENYPTNSDAGYSAAIHSPAYPNQAPPPTYPTLAPQTFATQPPPIYQTVPPTPSQPSQTQHQHQQQVTQSHGQGQDATTKDSERKGGNEKTSRSKDKKKNKKSKSKKRKDRKKKKEKTSKMCKMCEELSSEESSEERDIACEICDKSSKSRKHGKDKEEKDKEKGLLQSVLKVRPIHSKKPKSEENSGKSDEDDDEDVTKEDDSPEGQGGGGGSERSEDKDHDDDDDDDDVKDGDDDDDDHDDDGDSESETDDDASTTTTPQPTTSVSQPTIIDFVERAKQNKLMRIPVYRGKKLGAEEKGNDATNGTSEGKVDAQGNPIQEETSEFSSNIREGGEKPTKYSNKPNVKYSYPPKDTLPLQTCFHNPSGYVCCNLELNNVVESTYKEIREQPNFNPCNLQVIANKVQRASEKMFEHPFESIVSHADFAQNINFAGDLVCKLEIDGKYMIAYGTPYHADDAVGPQGPDGKPLPVRSLKL